MKKILQLVLSAVGGGMIGIFANQLNTVVGGICFALGVVLLTVSIAMVTDTNYKR